MVDAATKSNFCSPILYLYPMPVQTKRVIVAPLAWGLGHATRCIPVVEALLKMKCKVWVVLTPPQEALYRPHFGNRVEYLPLEEPPVDYRGTFAVAMVRQMPRLAAQMRRESSLAEWLTERIDPHLIISDNRYGFRSAHAPSVIIGHQLQLRAGLLSPLVNAVNRRLMRGFDAVWVPDNETRPNLSGALSHGKKWENISYIGPLSRLQPAPQKGEVVYNWLALLSGPEPQRTIFEDLLVEVAEKQGFRLALVAGQPEEGTAGEKTANIARFPHLSDRELLKVVEQSQAIVCRSGYSTLCDLAAMQRKALLVPTPGQTEQKYLAKHFSAQFGFTTIHQRNQHALKQALQSPEKHSEEFHFEFEDALVLVLKTLLG